MAPNKIKTLLEIHPEAVETANEISSELLKRFEKYGDHISSVTIGVLIIAVCDAIMRCYAPEEYDEIRDLVTNEIEQTLESAKKQWERFQNES